MLADGDAAEDGRVGAEAGEFFDAGFWVDDLAVGSGVAVVGEHDAMADEYVVFDDDAGAEEGVAFDFAAGSDFNAACDFYEGTDEGVVADGAAEDVHLLGVVDFHPGSELYVGVDHARKA